MYNPNQLRVEGFPRPTLVGLDGRVLELDCPAITGLNICAVSLTVVGIVDDLLPLTRKLVFPIAMPFRFALPPRIASTFPFMSPVPDSDWSALRNHGISAARTLA
jgi:hypothetical protein